MDVSTEVLLIRCMRVETGNTSSFTLLEFAQERDWRCAINIAVYAMELSKKHVSTKRNTGSIFWEISYLAENYEPDAV